MGRERNEQGRYSDQIPPDTVLDVFDARDDLARPVTASDVVDELGLGRSTAHNKLNRLVERGVLDTRKVGARGRVWWRPVPRDEWPDVDTTDAEESPHVDAEAVRNALDDLEAADERGDRREARDALQRARDALEDGEE